MYRLVISLLLFFATSCSLACKDCDAEHADCEYFSWWPFQQWWCEEYVDADFEPVGPSDVDTDSLIWDINTIAVGLESKAKHRLEFEDSIIYYNEAFIDKIWVKFKSMDIVYLWGARYLLTGIVEEYLE